MVAQYLIASSCTSAWGLSSLMLGVSASIGMLRNTQDSGVSAHSGRDRVVGRFLLRDTPSCKCCTDTTYRTSGRADRLMDLTVTCGVCGGVVLTFYTMKNAGRCWLLVVQMITHYAVMLAPRREVPKTLAASTRRLVGGLIRWHCEFSISISSHYLQK